MPSSYTSPSESTHVLLQERIFLVSVILGNITYGVHFTLFITAVSSFFKQSKRRKMDKSLFAFISVMFILGTAIIGNDNKVTELMFIDERNFPGGPMAYFTAIYSSPLRTFSGTAYCVANWLADILLIYRCLIIYNFRYWVVILPLLMLLGSITMGCLVLLANTRPNVKFWSTQSSRFALPYFSLSLSLNVLITLLIVIRILIYRHHTRKLIGPKHAIPYTSIVAILVESSALYSVFSILFLVMYARSSSAQILFLSVLAQVEMISPLLVVIRVAHGQGWSNDTARSVTTSLSSIIDIGSEGQFNSTSQNEIREGDEKNMTQ